MADKLLEQYQH